MTWTAKKITKARKKENLNTTTTANFLGISRPTYQNLEKGINIEKYQDRLEHYYNSEHSANQKRILKELGLQRLITKREEGRYKFMKSK